MNKILKPFTKKLPEGITKYQLLLDQESTKTLRAGLVTLEAGDSVGLHNTNAHEEVITILEGSGEVEINATEKLPVNQGMIAYVPPYTEHNVLNSGTGILKYIFIVTKVQ